MNVLHQSLRTARADNGGTHRSDGLIQD
jgi:hypothetical protein